MILKEELLQLFNEHRNITTIAEVKGVSRQTIYDWIEKSGFDYIEWKQNNKIVRKPKKQHQNHVINKSPFFEWSKTTLTWMDEAEKYNFSVYVLEFENSIYIGYTGDLSSRIFKHKQQFWTKQNKIFSIMYCEFFYDKRAAIDREWELICYYRLNNYELENKQFSMPKGELSLALDFMSEECINVPITPKPPFPGEYTNDMGMIIPTYKNFIEWCERNPLIPFAESMYHNCEGSKKTHWRSIVKTSFDLLKRMLEE